MDHLKILFVLMRKNGKWKEIQNSEWKYGSYKKMGNKMGLFFNSNSKIKYNNARFEYMVLLLTTVDVHKSKLAIKVCNEWANIFQTKIFYVPANKKIKYKKLYKTKLCIWVVVKIIIFHFIFQIVFFNIYYMNRGRYKTIARVYGWISFAIHNGKLNNYNLFIVVKMLLFLEIVFFIILNYIIRNKI